MDRKIYKEEAEWIGPENADQRLGVPPEKVVDLLGLMGDSADNIPGVRGVGKVMANKLLAQYSSIQDI
jgi:DNA polymerase-1